MFITCSDYYHRIMQKSNSVIKLSPVEFFLPGFCLTDICEILFTEKQIQYEKLYNNYIFNLGNDCNGTERKKYTCYC